MAISNGTRIPMWSFAAPRGKNLTASPPSLTVCLALSGTVALFAKDQIYFAGGRKRLAGYGRHDTTLRDHKPTNFLSDVMNAVPGKLCTFGLTWSESQLLGDIAAFDRKCAVVLVKGSPLRAFAEEMSELSAAGGETGLDAASAQGRLAASSGAQSEAYDKYVQKLQKARARYIEIDLYSRSWRSELAGFLEELVRPRHRIRKCGLEDIREHDECPASDRPVQKAAGRGRTEQAPARPAHARPTDGRFPEGHA